jgi:spore coat polysaccharide biosynthesis protein SpsF
MNKSADYTTQQEQFWAGEFGSEYIARNKSEQLLASNLNFFVKALKQAGKIQSCLEFGANIGMNLRALNLLYPETSLSGVEINTDASKILADFIGKQNVYEGSIFDYPVSSRFDLSLIKGVLIHINPDMLGEVYQKLYEASKKYILVCEYYNPSPVAINYRGHSDKLFKRDFAGEMMEKHPDLVLIDYGFAYRRDPAFPQDDITWFLMEKKG